MDEISVPITKGQEVEGILPINATDGNKNLSEALTLPHSLFKNF